MTDHDPMCRLPYFDDDPTDCDCDLIARVRADEAERIALKWQTGGWLILVKPFRTGAGQLVTDWLRAEAQR